MDTGERREFAKNAVASGALAFGDYTLKSKRKSRFFFDISRFNNGEAATRLGEMYAKSIQNLGLSYDLLFGPAYKGIPLVALVASSLFRSFGRNVGYAYDRKEQKSHGEKGSLVGHPLPGQKVIIVDDVLTAGTAARETLGKLRSFGAEAVALVVCFDRQEKGQTKDSAKTELENLYGLRVCSLFDFSDLTPEVQNHLRPAPDELGHQPSGFRKAEGQ